MHEVLAPGSRDVHRGPRRADRPGRGDRGRSGAEWTSRVVGDAPDDGGRRSRPRPGRAGHRAGELGVNPRARRPGQPCRPRWCGRPGSSAHWPPGRCTSNVTTSPDSSVAGNKARALEFLLGAALAAGCRRRRRGRQSELELLRGRRVAAAAVGLDCDLLFAGPASAGRRSTSSWPGRRARGSIFDAVATREELDAAVLLARRRSAGQRPASVCGAQGRRNRRSAPWATPARPASWPNNATSVGIDAADGGGGDRIRRHPGRSASPVRWDTACRGGSIGASVSRPADEVADQILATSRACAACSASRRSEICRRRRPGSAWPRVRRRLRRRTGSAPIWPASTRVCCSTTTTGRRP